MILLSRLNKRARVQRHVEVFSVEVAAFFPLVMSFAILMSKRMRSTVKAWSVTGLLLFSCVDLLSLWMSIDRFVFGGLVLVSTALLVVAFEVNRRHSKHSVHGK